MIRILFTIAAYLPLFFAASKDKPHGHKGSLQAYDGKPLPMKLSQDQLNKLSKGYSTQVYIKFTDRWNY